MLGSHVGGLIVHCPTHLDADIVANLNIFHQLAASYDLARSLVTAHERELGRQRPVAVDGVEVRVADAGILDVDKHLVRSGLRHRYLLVPDRPAGLLDYLCPLFLWDLRRHRFDERKDFRPETLADLVHSGYFEHEESRLFPKRCVWWYQAFLISSFLLTCLFFLPHVLSAIQLHSQ